MPISGPRIVIGQIVGPGGAATDFPVRPTINGGLFGPVAYPPVTLTATSPTQITAAGVTFTATSYTQDGSNFAYIGFNAGSTPSAAPANGTMSSFLVGMPNRTTAFTDKVSLGTNLGSCIDDTDSTINNIIVRSQPSSTNAYVAYLPNNTTSVHNLSLSLRYAIV